jgi:MFS transporter, SET family, sugar efflux transporter
MVRMQRPRFVLVLLAVLLVGMISASVNPMLALYLTREAGASQPQLSGVLAAFNTAGMAASLGLGLLADRRGKLRQTFVVASMSACGAYISLALVPPLWLITLVLVIFGGPALAVISLLFGLLRHSGLDDSQVIYARAAFSTSWIIGPAVGVLLVRDVGFGALFAFSSLVSALSMLGVLFFLPRSSSGGAVVLYKNDRREREEGRRVSVGWIVVVMVVAFACLQAVNSVTVSFLPILTADLRRIDLSWSGIALGVCAGLEVLILFTLGRLRYFGRSRAAIVGIGSVVGLVYVLGLSFFTSVPALLALQLPNAIFIATVLGVGMQWFQDMSRAKPGLMTAIYMNTSRLGALLAAPALGLGGLGPLWASAGLATAGVIGVLAASHTSRRNVDLAN